MLTTIAVDCMGGDHGPAVTLPAIADFLKRDVQCAVVAVGLEAQLSEPGAKLSAEFGQRFRICHASEVVGMDEPVASALRLKKDSSMRVAIDLVKRGEAGAAVSAGNTGALMAISRFVLKTIDGIDRPAICSILPSQVGRTYVLDLGANVDCSAEHLLQFGVMGASLAAALEHKDKPSVGLLNIGEEDIKGNEVVKRAGELLKQSGLNFYGNVEGNDIYKGTTDVVVCDGFVGNVALKASEGLAQFLSEGLKSAFSSSPLRKLAALVVLPVLREFKNRFDHRRYNGASLLGLRGVVVKSHGSADVYGFSFALERAVEAARWQLPEKIANRMAQLPQVPSLCD